MKIIFNTETGETSPYPRADDEPVIGLAAPLITLEVVTDPQPVINPETHYLESVTGRDGDTWRTTWEKKEIAPFVEPIAGIAKSQLRIWLKNNGITDLVTEAIQKLDEPPRSEAEIRWECTMVYERNHPLVAAIGEKLNMNSDDLDNLFREAALL